MLFDEETTKNIIDRIYKNIDILKVEKELTAERLSLDVGKSQNWYTQAKKNKSPLKIIDLLAICKTYDVNLSEIVPDDIFKNL